MISARLGWSRNETEGLTIKEAREVLSELAHLDEQESLRLAEAFHAPKNIGERLKQNEPKKNQMDMWAAAKAAVEGANPILQAKKSKTQMIIGNAKKFLREQHG